MKKLKKEKEELIKNWNECGFLAGLKGCVLDENLAALFQPILSFKLNEDDIKNI